MASRFAEQASLAWSEIWQQSGSASCTPVRVQDSAVRVQDSAVASEMSEMAHRCTEARSTVQALPHGFEKFPHLFPSFRFRFIHILSAFWVCRLPHSSTNSTANSSFSNTKLHVPPVLCPPGYTQRLFREPDRVFTPYALLCVSFTSCSYQSDAAEPCGASGISAYRYSIRSPRL